MSSPSDWSKAADERGQIHSPLDWTFVPARLLMSPAGRTFLKLIRIAIARLE